MDPSSETTVRRLLGAAQLPASDTEVADLVAGYPALADSVAALYAPAEVRYLDPALRFRADAGTAADWAAQ